MKGFTVGPEVVVAVLIGIVVVAWGIDFITTGEFELTDTGSYEYIECEYNSDCAGDRLCLSIDGGEYFCGCLEDADCPGRCVNNECVSAD